jgi:thiamine biosynthesis lipoprotein
MKQISILFSILLLVACQSKTQPDVEVQVYSGNALGTTFEIQFFAETELEIGQQIDSTFTILNNSLSTYIPTSDISKINQGDTSVVVDNQFKTNFLASKEIFKLTNGYFDPTVGVLVNAYGFGPKKYNIELNQKSIDSLMQFVGLDKVELDANNHIIKQYSETFLDFNSIAKGYAVDRLAALLNQYDVEHYLIEVGGELVAKGKNLSKESLWRIGIDKPNPEPTPTRELLQFIVELDHRAMATSGNYRKFKTDEFGNKFVHTINPKTGESEASDILSASVFAGNCMLADAYATAFMAMGFEHTKELLPKLKGIEVILIYADGQEVNTFISQGMKAYVK